ncbi:hypothetical protein [Mangrovimonas sp. DI 80]|uniref:hypothetical protein n=1 Tax=Mangrovimonas sp. DI 80 TaxID=1779330 RepID=UPI0009774521|nr:hypothetical protein [Mangrovimonas sp. DI 80]OMP30469.1 hypothetical protein BKM32_13920 [Mangrovimonas sp. DI 80]
MKFKLVTLSVILSFTLFNCKQESSTPDIPLIYANRNEIKLCNSKDSLLLNEALQSFETDLLDTYGDEKKNSNRAYTQFFNAVRTKRIDYTTMASDHTKEVLGALKTQQGLWVTDGTEYHLNYNNPIVECVSTNMTESGFKTTFKALLDTNSMSYRMYGEAIRKQTTVLNKDKYLALFVALDMYYAKMLNIDFSKVEAASNVDFNQTPPKQEDNHEGHNH